MSLDYRVRLVAGPQKLGAQLALREGRSATIGRREDCSLVLASARVSPVHVRLHAGANAWRIEAGETTMGHTPLLLINEARCSQGSLTPGDMLDVGGHRFRFEDDLPVAGEAGRRDALRLQIRHGPSAPEKTFSALFGESFIVGHSQTALWLLPEPSASRHHCRIESGAGGWIVRDLQSRNGTFLNGERVKSAPLCHLDRLMIGKYDVQVSLIEAAEAS